MKSQKVTALKEKNLKQTIVIRLVGDSGDGMQLVGEQLTLTAALSGRDVRTQPDFPAEIRAPAGTVSGVSGFQLAISETRIFTAGEALDVLVVLNPAALKQAISALKLGGLLIINEDNFQPKDWEKAGLESDFLEAYRDNHHILSIPLISNTKAAIAEHKTVDITHAEASKAKNFYTLGIILWLFDFSTDYCVGFIQEKFKLKPTIAKANEYSLLAGYHFGETLELAPHAFYLNNIERPEGDYRLITGIHALTLALTTLTIRTQTPLLVSGYPITPASAILEACAPLSEYGIHLFQAEDEIAAICACLGAAFGGQLALTCTSGPGFDLKSEGLGLGIMTELPMVLVDVQRAGPSTGLPTKTGQSDLNQALFGRHGESTVPVLAAKSPADCFVIMLEAFDIAIRYMTPVVLLLDASLANASETWKIPNVEELNCPTITYNRFTAPYQRDEQLSRSWNVPGSPDLMHRIGGLEKQGVEGAVSYDPGNHQHMVALRQKKIANIAKAYPPLEIEGDPDSDYLLISWGSTYGSVKSAIEICKLEGLALASIHLRHLNPLPLSLKDIIKRYRHVLVAELNSGQLCQILRATYLVDARPITQTNGLPFAVSFLARAIHETVQDLENVL